MLSLLFVLSEYLPESGGGIITFYQHLLPQLVSAGARVEVLIARNDQLDRPSTVINGVTVNYLTSESLECARAGYERFAVGFPTLSAFLPVAWAAYEQAKRGEGFDVVEVTDWQVLFLPWVAAGSLAPVNVLLHGSCGQLTWHDRSPSFPMEADLIRTLETCGLVAADQVQTHSRSNARAWERLIEREIEVILPALPLNEALHEAPSPGSHGLVVGRLQWWKGPQVLCQALRAAPELTVRWIGRDALYPATGRPMSDWLKEQYGDVFGLRLQREEQVPRGEVQEELSRAAYVCVPSTWDVFNLTAAEAMAAGVPVVCSQEAGAAMLIEDGVNGFLADPNEPITFAHACRRAVSLTPEQRLAVGAAARSTISKLLDPARIAKAKLDSYQRLAGSVGKRRASDPWLTHAIGPRGGAHETRELLASFSMRQLATTILSKMRRKMLCGS